MRWLALGSAAEESDAVTDLLVLGLVVVLGAVVLLIEVLEAASFVLVLRVTAETLPGKSRGHRIERVQLLGLVWPQLQTRSVHLDLAMTP